tara:strand:+ start:355 stop:516 length:162 start_codon:yes stop_codon:yes gene_type:complete
VNTLAVVNQLPDWMNHQVVAGNSWPQLLPRFNKAGIEFACPIHTYSIGDGSLV